MAQTERIKLQGLVSIAKRPLAFLKDTFFSNEIYFDTEKVELDIDVLIRTMAEYSSRGSISKQIEKEGFISKTYIPPYINLSEVLDETIFKNRTPGLSAYDSTAMSKKDWAKLRAISKMDMAIKRREEYQCMEALFNAKITVGGDTISFGRDSDLSVTLSGADKWDQSTANIHTDLEDWRDLLLQKSGFPGTDVILGIDAWKNMKTNAAFLALLDKFKVNIGSIQPQEVAPGVYKVMYLETIGNFWIYPEKYVDPADSTEKALIPADKICYVAAGAQRSFIYGACPIANDNSGIEFVAGARIMDTDLQKDPAMEKLIMRSAPLAQLTNPHGSLLADVV